MTDQQQDEWRKVEHWYGGLSAGDTYCWYIMAGKRTIADLITSEADADQIVRDHNAAQKLAEAEQVLETARWSLAAMLAACPVREGGSTHREAEAAIEQADKTLANLRAEVGK